MAYQAIRGGGSGLQFLNNPFGDTTYTKVFVGGLAWETKSETLHSYFEKFGDILEAVVISDKHTGRSKGYGFVTFSDPEAAKRACVDPNPVIDGRKANCNLASLGRPQPSLPYVRLRPAVPYFGSPRLNAGSPSYQQPVPYSYQPGFPYPPYGYSAYGPEYMYPQGFYSSYMGHPQPHMYSVPGAAGTNAFPYGQLGQPGTLGYRPIQGFVMPGGPGPHLMQYGRPNVSGAISETIPTVQAPYFTGMSPSMGQARSISSVNLSQVPRNSGSD
ncbi:hypothetical protein DCAR_0103147 [Daucus carota subsp. sativus]|uniref:RRM domain-containing protein n=1 Tax=Daucus carota subsp. sativus TaxID=79200 RepID=A0AAF1AIP0_DAUCS|nr:hypothetical protein DCAR_0103147 [Daucus carota subsp. sativus]